MRDTVVPVARLRAFGAHLREIYDGCAYAFRAEALRRTCLEAGLPHLTRGKHVTKIVCEHVIPKVAVGLTLDVTRAARQDGAADDLESCAAGYRGFRQGPSENSGRKGRSAWLPRG